MLLLSIKDSRKELKNPFKTNLVCEPLAYSVFALKATLHKRIVALILESSSFRATVTSKFLFMNVTVIVVTSYFT